MNTTSNAFFPSVVIPVYNGAKFIAEAIESVYKDEGARFEVIVVDDGSEDHTPDVVSRYPEVVYHRQENQGVAAARNTGISMAKGNVIAFLDSDDIWLPGRFAQSQAFLTAHPEIDFLLGLQYMFLEPGTPKPAHISDDSFCMATRVYGTGAMTARMSCFEKVGLFNTTYATAEDSEWMQRAQELGLRYAWLPEPVIKRRMHGKNISEVSPERHKLNVLRILKESIQRKKKNHG